MNENCFLITAYCDTPEKEDILKRSVIYLRDVFKDFDILVYDHYKTSSTIQNWIHYYIKDYSNPVLTEDEKIMYRWYDVSDFIGKPTKAINIFKDAGYAVLSMWKNGVSFLKLHDYKKVCIITYDSYAYGLDFIDFVKDGLLKLDYSDCVMQKYGDGIAYSMNYAMFNVNSFCEKIIPKITKEKYLSYRDYMVEHILYFFIEEAKMRVVSDSKLKERNLIHTGRYQDIGVDSISMFWFGVDLDGTPTVIIYDDDNENIEVIISVGKGYVTHEIGKNHFIVMKLEYSVGEIEYLDVVKYCGKEINKRAYNIDESFWKNNKIIEN